MRTAVSENGELARLTTHRPADLANEGHHFVFPVIRAQKRARSIPGPGCVGIGRADRSGRTGDRYRIHVHGETTIADCRRRRCDCRCECGAKHPEQWLSADSPRCCRIEWLRERKERRDDKCWSSDAAAEPHNQYVHRGGHRAGRADHVPLGDGATPRSTWR